MQQPIPASQEETAWLTARTATLAAAGRTRQRSHTARIEQRLREEEVAWRLTKFTLFVLIACLAITIAAFTPVWCDALRHSGPLEYPR